MISKGQSENLETLIRAARDGALCIMEVTDSKTGDLVDAVCAVNIDGENYDLVPLAVMVRENSYERFVPPEMAS